MEGMLSGRKILVLEDETFLRKSLCNYLESKGADTFAADSLAEARHVMEGGELDFALLDVNLPDGNGMDLLQDPGFPSTTRVVIMTADGGIRTAIEAMKKGASDYLSKPFDPDELPMVFTRIEREAVHNRIKEHEEVSRLKTSESLFTGQRMQAVRGQLEKILKADQRLATGLPPVLIEGETGTGKSTIARWLHENGPRRASPLIEINCSTLPDSLAESELFGHERGAFTDARKERIGLFEAADGGSLFLDEIASLSPAIQAKVLTAVEDGRIRRVGGNTLRRVDVRLIAASLHPLEKLVREGTFREDLYHRLNLLHVRIPPLRDFPQDIPALAGHLLESLKKRYRLPGVTVSEAGTASLIAHSWPGNVRELIHELERALIFSEGKAIEFPQLQPGPGSEHGTAGNSLLLNPMWQIPEGDYHFEEALQALVQAVIDRALEQEKGNVSAAARRLGVSRDFIRYRRNS
jgi:DNA-binding NtrC family response regulator